MTYTKSQQNLRLAKIVSELKCNKQVNTQSLAEYFRAHEHEPGAPLGCSARTVARDIQHLQQALNAPIEYDESERTYVLTDHSWSFSTPIFDDEFVSMTMLGVQLAEELAPEPLKSEMDRALTQTLTENSSKFFDRTMMETILAASGVKSHIEPKIFQVLFDAWRLRQCVKLNYHDPQGKSSEHDFEPHLLVFHNGNWYTKGYLMGLREVRVFACQRITGVAPLLRMFQSDRKLLEETRRNGVFNYPKIAGIKLHCDASIAFYIREQQKKFQSKLEPQADGSLVVTLNPTVEHEVMRWVLGEGGRIQVLEPQELREKVAEAGREITRRNSSKYN